MRPRLLALLVVALVPALVIAAPRGKKKKKAKPAPTEKEAAPEPAPTPDPAKGSAATPMPAPAGSGSAPAPLMAGSGSGSGSAEPPKLAPPGRQANEEPPPEKTNEPDVDSLRQEYLSLRDELFKSRARANTVASQLYSSRIQIKLTFTSGRYYNPAKASIRLDGASVYENTTGAIATDDGIRFEGFVAPGRHVVTFRVEATGKDDDTFVSTTESQIVVKAVANKDLVVAAKAKDSGDIAYEWKKKEKGSYGLGLDVSVKTVANGGGKK